MDRTEIVKKIKRDLLALGQAAPEYQGGESVGQLLSYLNHYVGTYLRGLQGMGVLRSYRFGISPVFFWTPQLRVVLADGTKEDIGLAGIYKIRPCLLGKG